MHNHELFNSLAEQMLFNVNVTSQITHEATWKEQRCKKTYNIWLITSGTVSVTIDDTEFLLNKGDIFFFYPQVFYSAHAVNGPCSFIYTHFDISLGKNVRTLEILKPINHINSEYIKEEVKLFLLHYKSYINQEVMSYLSFKSALAILVSKAFKVMSERNTDLNAIINRTPYAKLEKILIYIAENINKPIKIKTLADYMFMSEKYFYTFFKNTMGITPRDYISQKKLKQAYDYLSNYKYSVKETANLLGYSDAYVFSKSFKKYYGVPPSKIRKI